MDMKVQVWRRFFLHNIIGFNELYHRQLVLESPEWCVVIKNGDLWDFRSFWPFFWLLRRRQAFFRKKNFKFGFCGKFYTHMSTLKVLLKRIFNNIQAKNVDLCPKFEFFNIFSILTQLGRVLWVIWLQKQIFWTILHEYEHFHIDHLNYFYGFSRKKKLWRNKPRFFFLNFRIFSYFWRLISIQ